MSAPSKSAQLAYKDKFKAHASNESRALRLMSLIRVTAALQLQRQQTSRPVSDRLCGPAFCI
jgi:hypothetical protein